MKKQFKTLTREKLARLSMKERRKPLEDRNFFEREEENLDILTEVLEKHLKEQKPFGVPYDKELLKEIKKEEEYFKKHPELVRNYLKQIGK